MEPVLNPIGGLILCAGLSSRMGTFKPLMEIDGKSMLRRVYENLRLAGADPIVIVTGYRAETVRQHMAGLPVLFVHNPDYAQTQMMDSVKLGLAALSGACRRILITPADVPLTKPETIMRLVHSRGLFVRPVCSGKGGHPVILDAQLLPAILEWSGEGGLKGALGDLGIPVTGLACDDVMSTIDLDSPNDFQFLMDYCKL